jgi:hypothetical protein
MYLRRPIVRVALYHYGHCIYLLFFTIKHLQMKKRTKNITIALSLMLLTLGVLASIPSDGVVMVGKVLFTDTGGSDTGTEPDTGTGTGTSTSTGTGTVTNKILTREVCTKTWICPNGTITLTSGRLFRCTPLTGFDCLAEDEIPCDAPKPDCLIFPS